MKRFAAVALFLAGAIADQVSADYCGSRGLGLDDEVRTIFKDAFQAMMQATEETHFIMKTELVNLSCIPPRAFNKFNQEEFSRLSELNGLVMVLNKISHIAPDAFATREPLTNLANFEIHDALTLGELPSELLHNFQNLKRFVLRNTAVSDLPLGLFEMNKGVTIVQLHQNLNMITVPQELSRIPSFELLDFFGCEFMDFPTISPVKGATVNEININSTKMGSVDFLSAIHKLGIVFDYCASLGLGSDAEVRTAVKDQFRFLVEFPQITTFFLGTTLDNFKCVPPRVFSEFGQEEFNRLRNIEGLVVRMLTIEHVAPDAFTTREPLASLENFEIEDALTLTELSSKLLHSMPNLKRFVLDNTAVSDLPIELFEKNEKISTVQLSHNRNMLTIPQELSRFQFYESLVFFGSENMDFPTVSPLEGVTVSHVSFSSTKMDTVGFFEAIEKLGIIYI